MDLSKILENLAQDKIPVFWALLIAIFNLVLAGFGFWQRTINIASEEKIAELKNSTENSISQIESSTKKLVAEIKTKSDESIAKIQSDNN